MSHTTCPTVVDGIREVGRVVKDNQLELSTVFEEDKATNLDPVEWEASQSARQ